MSADDYPSFAQPQGGYPPPPQQQQQQYSTPQQAGYPPQATYPPPQGGHQQAPYPYGGGAQQASAAGFEHGYGQQQYTPPQQTIVQMRGETSIPVYVPGQFSVCEQYIPAAESGSIVSLRDYVSPAEHTEIINSINSIFRQEFSEIARISLHCNIISGVLFVVGFGLFVAVFFSGVFVLPSIGFGIMFCSIVFQIISRLILKSRIEKAWVSSSSAISIVSASKLEERGVQYRLKKEEIPVININTGQHTGSLTQATIVVDVAPSATPLSQMVGSYPAPQNGVEQNGQSIESAFGYDK